MFTILDYQITEKLYESPNSIVYRGHQDTTNQSVVLKVLKQSYPPPEIIAWFKREYEITKGLNINGVVEVYSLENDQNCWVMVVEDFGGESIARLMLSQQFTLTEFLPLAIELVDILGQVHQRHIMHKDINPSNIVVNRKTSQIKLIDFGISTVLSRENPSLRNPNKLEGTLAYISPEQTGRMNRAVDYRTDFYSLGATFYQLLTGQLPFETTNVMELVHSHIAKHPTPPHELKSEIPLPLSDIVMKLMAKNAEDRYQSAYGLKADLEECYSQWQSTGCMIKFTLGQEDISDRFQVTQNLYGRDEAIHTLLASFERVSQGNCEMMLVYGYSGIGKSALVQEVYKPITRQQGYFIFGKFDQFQRDIPYYSLVQAFRSLVRQLLTESKAQIVAWREQLLMSLRENGQVIIDVIPEVELIIGPQSAVAELGPTEAQNRFNLVFQNFIRVFTQASHPLVIFLDDLQWADRASLQLMQLLMTATDSHYLLLIGAYRNNEVSEAHPLMLTLDEIYKEKALVNHIHLTPLDLPNVNQLIADSIKCLPKETIPLAELVLTKTNGNPFFINEFLKSLYNERLLIFDFSRGVWQWDLEQIKGRNITDNVVELMASKVEKLAEETQQTLKLAACIGNQYDLRTLAIVYEKSSQETATYLWPAMVEGLIIPLSDTYKLIELDVEGLTEEVTVEYKFAHDRIQQAVYSLISRADKQAVHWQIGQLLLQNIPLDKHEQKIFDIVNQLNWGRELINQQIERYELAQLNLMAGKKAKSSTAYKSALNYLQVGLSLLGEDSWQQQYDLSLALHVEAAEAAYLNDNFEQTEELASVVREQAKTVLDMSKVYQVRIRAYCNTNHQLLAAVKIGREMLEQLDIYLPETPSQLDIQQALEKTKSSWLGKEPSDLIDLPLMNAPDKLVAISILSELIHPTYEASPELFCLVVLTMVDLSVKYGNTMVSAIAYAAYGTVLCGVVLDIDSGYQFGQLALKLVERLNAKAIKACIIFFVNVFIVHWKKHLRTTLNPCLEAYQLGIETGDLLYGTLGVYTYCHHLYWSGEDLNWVEREMAKYSHAMSQIKQEHLRSYQDRYWQVVLNLMGQSENPCRLIGKSYDEEQILPIILRSNDIYSIFEIYLHKLIFYYLFYELNQAIENAVIAEKNLTGALSTRMVVNFHFYDSLARLAVFAEATESEQQYILEKVAANQKKMELWAHHAPMNCLHKFYLVAAELARVLGRNSEAKEYYDQAIALAHESEYLNEEALAYELAARFYLARNQQHVARYYLQDAHYTYQRWGAVAKVKDLERRYPQFLAKAATDTLKTSVLHSTTESGQTTSGVLDLNSVFQASQAISSEIALEKLLEKLMKIEIENAGAQKGFLVLDKVGNLVIEAEGTVDSDNVTTLQSVPIDSVDPKSRIPLLSAAIIYYVARTQENLVLNDAAHEGQFIRDPYIVATQPKSILCIPLLHQGKLSGILYLENNLTTSAFTPERVEILRILSAQAAISIENSRLYEQLEEYSKTLEQKVSERTEELQERNQELASTLKKLKATQAQIIAQEKLASLGALTAGIAHEIKNPLNFVNNFAELSIELTEELREEIESQQERLDPETKDYIEEILSDLSQNSQKINEHGKRADNIVRGMLMHSRGQTGERQMTDLNFLLAEAVNLAYHGMHAKDASFNIKIATNYDNNLEQVNIVPQNISRAFINLINNACYAAHHKKTRLHPSGNAGEEFLPTLSVSSHDLGEQIEVRIRDNGEGIPQDVLDKIFNPFFTTKPPGEGTGLGLSISHDIIVQQHQGNIQVETEVGSYTEFIVTLPKFTLEKNEVKR
jgi:predicted ATPase/signal transduction histidine kinase